MTTQEKSRRKKRVKKESTLTTKQLLHLRLREKRLLRTSQHAIDCRIVKLENKMEKSQDEKEREKYEKEIEYLEDIEEKQWDTQNNDYAEYAD